MLVVKNLPAHAGDVRDCRLTFQVFAKSKSNHLYYLNMKCIIPGGSDGKESACNAEDLGSISGLGRPPGEGHGNPLQYSYLENPMDSEAWQATVHGVAKSWTELSEFHFHTRCRSQR